MDAGRVTDSNVRQRLVEGLDRCYNYKTFTEDMLKSWEKAKGKPMPANIKSAIGQALHNTAGLFGQKIGKTAEEFMEHMDAVVHDRKTEDTFSTDVTSLARFTFPVIVASIPTLVATDVVSVQPIDRPTADIYYINILYDQTKYGYAVDDDVLTAKGAPPYSTHLTDEWDQYVIDADGGGTLSATIRYLFIYASSITLTYVISGTTFTATDNGSGTISGSGISSGTINYDTGEIAVTFSGSPANPSTVTITYRYRVEKNPTAGNTSGLPKIKLELETVTVTAKQRWLAALWSVVSQYNLSTIHNVEADQLLLNAIVGLLNHEIDTEILDTIQSSTITSGAGSISFAATNPYTGVNLQQYYQDLMFTLAEGDSLITAATGAPGANVIIAGFDFCNIIQGLPSQFFVKEPWKEGTYGPHRLGVLGGQYLVIRNPGYTDSTFVMLFKGGDYLHSSYVFAPYMPFRQVGPSELADDMKGRVGIVTSNAFAAVNASLGVDGTIS